MRAVYRWLRGPLSAAIARFPPCRAGVMRCPQAGVRWGSRAGHPLRHWLRAILLRCPRLHMCAVASLLLLLSGPWGAAGVATATPRDPFAIPTQARCELQPAEKLAWQLQGVIGQPGDFHAWLVAAPATRLRLRTGDTLPGTRWQVVEIARRSVTLDADNGCPPPLRLALKERNYGQTTDPTAATDADADADAQRPGAG